MYKYNIVNMISKKNNNLIKYIVNGYNCLCICTFGFKYQLMNFHKRWYLRVCAGYKETIYLFENNYISGVH